MVSLDHEKIEQVAQEALTKISGNRRSELAIAKAKAQLESNPHMHFDGESLLTLSPSGEIYRANSECQCRAFANHQPCWHRAAARLVKRYNETSH